MRGHIRKGGKNIWRIVVDLGRDPATGKRKQKWQTVYGTKKDAERVLREILTQIDKNTYIEPCKMTLAEYLTKWLQSHKDYDLAPKTYEDYKTIVEKHLIPSLGHISLSKLQPFHLQEYYVNALKNGRKDGRGQNLSRTTVNKHHRVLHRALEEAVKMQLILRNPADLVEPPKPEEYNAKTLTVEEIEKVLKEASGSRMYLPVLLAISTGMRRGEILGLRWRDINFEERTISVVQTLQRNSNGLEYRQPKTKKSRRLIELPASVVEELKKHRLQQKKERLLLGEAYKDNDLVCCWPDGSPLKPDWVSRNWQNLCKKLGIKGVRYHDLRHTHSTLLMSWGVPTKVISERLGHSNTQITDDIYSHVLPGIQREVAKLLEERIFARIYKDTKARSTV